MHITHERGSYRADPDGSRLRVVLLTSDDPQHSYLRRLLASRLDLVATIVEPGSAQKRRLRRNGRYYDLAFRLYQGWRQRLTGRARQRRQYFGSLSLDLPDPTSPQHIVESVNSTEAKQLISDLQPDLTVVCGTGILGRTLIAQTPGLMVNIHGGWLPEYKGNHGVYFAYLRQDWSRIGATLHVVTPELDAGPILAKVTPPIHPNDTDEHLYARSVHHAALRLTELAADLEKGKTLMATLQWPGGTTYRHRDRKPLPELAMWLRRKAGLHRPAPAAEAPAHTGVDGTAARVASMAPEAWYWRDDLAPVSAVGLHCTMAELRLRQRLM